MFVGISDKAVKEKIENLFSRDSLFEIVQNSQDADLIYWTGGRTDSRPVFGAVESSNLLPVFPGRSSELGTPGIATQEPYRNYERESKRTTLASVTYQRPDGTSVIIWSKASVEFDQNVRHGGGGTLFIDRPSATLFLAEKFVQAVKKEK